MVALFYTGGGGGIRTRPHLLSNIDLDDLPTHFTKEYACKMQENAD